MQTPPTPEDAIRAAAEARARAYAPYSKFAMGAAVVTGSGQVVPGALVENISFGLTMCAERIALFGVVASGLDRPIMLALVAAKTNGSLTWPCGSCLQVAMEIGGPDLLVVVSDGLGESATSRLGELASRLPHKNTRQSP